MSSNEEDKSSIEIFESGYFQSYRDEKLITSYRSYFKNVQEIYSERRGWRESEWDLERLLGLQREFLDRIREKAKSDKYVFISHNHKDLDDMLDIICFLSRAYHIGVYIDCFDRRQPLITSIKTAALIKEAIADAYRFVFMATNRAIASKWCNWELGYGDALMHRCGKLAFWAMHDTRLHRNDFRGNEYMEVYPFIVRHPRKGKCDSNGYSVRMRGRCGEWYEPLEEWLK